MRHRQGRRLFRGSCQKNSHVLLAKRRSHGRRHLFSFKHLISGEQDVDSVWPARAREMR